MNTGFEKVQKDCVLNPRFKNFSLYYILEIFPKI